ncbi:MAG: tRNA preQ1(34) S-adenosylmethionine ribosyltransferase-isomerase QueA [Patescibacteria group bacterium]|jgi:S-adenosylmethionine:tRNA ribosyltransferase-isomerase|nr:tRNA preQ1(34) S-adenosylmethionine ribosyltransferase-isomerase QueA [Patescibacteria group bacterium]
MKISDFDFELPNNLIATTPANPRDSSRLLVLDKKDGEIEHKKFYDILSYLEKGDLLVLNNSKVFPARLIGETEDTGRKVEVFLLNNEKENVWKCLIGGRKIEEGLRVKVKDNFVAEIIKDNNDGTWLVDFSMDGKELMEALHKYGEIPLPPYIEKQRKAEENTSASSAQDPSASSGQRKEEEDRENYQTVFADDEKNGSVAAPTAGLHFTPELLKKIKEKGVEIEYITLHVGMGTFAPVKVDDPKKHKMHSEWVEIKKEVVEKINKTKENGGRVIAVGTTTSRALESLIEIRNSKFEILNSPAWVDIFIYPGYKFRVVDAMITNFHLPKSTLLMLVSAFACAEPSRSARKESIDKAYKEAIKNNYRFYSYGDAMLIK